MNFESGRWGILEVEDLLQRRLDDSLSIHDRAEAVGIATHNEIIDERNVRINVKVDGQIDAFHFNGQHEVIQIPVTADLVLRSPVAPMHRYHNVSERANGNARVTPHTLWDQL